MFAAGVYCRGVEALDAGRALSVVAVQRCARRRERLEPAAENNVKCRLKASVSC